LIGITDRLLAPSEYRKLLMYRVGLTDLAKTVSGPDSRIKTSDFDHPRLRRIVESYGPFALAFTSKNAGQSFFGNKRNYGRQPEMLGTTRAYILPSTSGLAISYWSKDWWLKLAADIRDR
jgi:TDG/mug DNA glycosylase family protein